MDPISGSTAFALCDLQVISIGSKIQTESGAALTADLVTVTFTKASDFDSIVSTAPHVFGGNYVLGKLIFSGHCEQKEIRTKKMFFFVTRLTPMLTITTTTTKIK